jgi:hypothetical protein
LWDNRTQLQIDYDAFQNLNVGYFNSRERDPSIHWIGGCVGARVGLDTVEKRKL